MQCKQKEIFQAVVSLIVKVKAHDKSEAQNELLMLSNLTEEYETDNLKITDIDISVSNINKVETNSKIVI